MGNNRRTVKTPTTPHISDQSGTENACKTLLCWLFIIIWLLVCNICSHLKVMNYCVFQHSHYIFSWQFLKYQYKLITWHVLQNVKQSGRNLVINWNDVANIGMILAHYWPIKFLATQKSELVKYLKTTFSPHVRRLHAHNLRYQKQDRFWIGWFRILTAQLNLSTGQLRKMISQTFGPVGDSSAELLVWNSTASSQLLYDYYI